MKPYGNARIENASCRGGCCSLGTVKTHYRSSVPKAYSRRARKQARRDGKKESTTP